MIDPRGPQTDPEQQDPPAPTPSGWTRVQLGGSVTDLLTQEEAP